MKRKLLLRSIGCLALVLCAVLVFGTTSSIAISLPMDLTGVEIGSGGQAYQAYFGPTINDRIWARTEYTFKADQLPGDWGWKAFCVQAVYIDATSLYTLIPIPANFDPVAVKMADQFFFAPIGTQRDYQIAIWHQLRVVEDPLAPPAGSQAAVIFNYDWNTYVPIKGEYAIAQGFESQDFLVRVPEPGTILLLGAGLIGLAGFRRFRKK